MTLRASSGSGIAGNVTKISTGTAAPASNGGTSSFAFAHSLGVTPAHVTVIAKNALSATDFYVTWDSTNITVNYLAFPNVGTLSFSWVAFV